MTLEEMLRRVYGAAMTPLPGPPKVDVGPLMEALRGMRAPSVGELPQMPEAWRRYAEREGLYPERQQGVGTRAISPQWQPIGAGMEQLDPVSVERYNQYFGGQR